MWFPFGSCYSFVSLCGRSIAQCYIIPSHWCVTLHLYLQSCCRPLIEAQTKNPKWRSKGRNPGSPIGNHRLRGVAFQLMVRQQGLKITWQYFQTSSRYEMYLSTFKNPLRGTSGKWGQGNKIKYNHIFYQIPQCQYCDNIVGMTNGTLTKY